MDANNVTNSIDAQTDVIPDSCIPHDNGLNDIIIAHGMTFGTPEEIELLYSSYAKKRGFGFRRRNTRANVVQLVCIREGFHKSKTKNNTVGDSGNQESSCFTKSSRIDCRASLHFALNTTTKMWHIMKFDDSHNHEMVTPQSIKYLRTYKRVTNTAKALSEVFESQGIPVAKVVNVLNSGHDEVAFTKKDCNNHITVIRRKILDVGDANAVYNYCVRQQEENPDFRFSFSFDDDDRMTNLFWVDARSRIAYQIFGDVVSFDTTYRTNKYNMSFAPFVGIDNHRHTILFGCALLQNETEESFIWLFEAWLRAMDGKHPISFLTDQDAAMMKAVAKVFPAPKHRLCLWHITKKFPERLSHIFHEKSKFKTDLNRCIHNSMIIENFEMSWEMLVIEYNLTENEWLEGLYSIRHLWVPCFNKNVFFGGMNTTGRSESINAFFDAYIKSGMTLKELVHKCEEAIQCRYDLFRRAEFDSKHKVPILTLNMGLEKHAGSVYTSEIFKLFHNELTSILGCRRTLLNEESTRHLYRVECDSEQNVLVEFDTNTKESSCECMLFEFQGILCKHILSIFHMLNVDKIPSNYIMNRWTKGAAYPIFTCKVAYRLESQTSMRSFEVKETLEELHIMCVSSDEVFKDVKEFIKSTKHKFSDVMGEVTGNETHEEYNNYFQENQNSQILDPNITQTKGRKRASKCKVPRIQSGLEEASNNSVRCSVCNKGGHNKRIRK